MKDRGHGENYRGAKNIKLSGQKEGRSVTVDAGGFGRKASKQGTFGTDPMRGRGISGGRYGKVGPGKGPKGTRMGPGRRAPPPINRMGFRDT